MLRHAKTNVLLLHLSPEPDDPDTSPCSSRGQLFSKVLVPTDFSRPANEALAFVKTIAGIREIVLLHVVSKAESQDEIQKRVTESKTRLEDIKKDHTVSGISVSLHVRVGDPTEMILSVAEEDDVSLIAMSAYGTDWLREMRLGSTMFTVVRRTKRPVLVIRTGQENETS